MSQRKAFVAIDGSLASEAAFNWYLDNVWREGDFVYLVHSAEYKVDIGFLPGYAADVDAISKAVHEEDTRISEMTNSFMQRLRGRSITGEVLLIKGQKPGEAIIAAATEKNAHMIIMGSRGLGKVRRTLLGSVSEYVTHHAPSNCSVTIIRES